MSTQPSPPTQLLNEFEAADLLNIKPATLRRWRWSGKGPLFRKIGEAVRYHPGDLMDFIEAAKRSSTSDQGETENDN